MKKALWYSFEETLNGYSRIQNFPLEENKPLDLTSSGKIPSYSTECTTHPVK